MVSSEALVSALWVYPVKSCRGIAIERSAVEARGLRNDRRWMIVDGEGTFVTQRTEPRLALVEVGFDREGALVLRAPGASEVRVANVTSVADATSVTASASVDDTEAPRPTRRVTVWRDTVDAVDCGPEAARWLTAWLGSEAFLVHMPDDVRRQVKPDYAKASDIVSFADGFPLLVASTSSLDDLNARMGTPLPMNRFRPNIVVTGFAPWAEDGWRRLRVGDVEVRVVKPCARCTITTTDQETGERASAEPLRTLATFRRDGSDVLFAQNAIPDVTGEPAQIAVGDRVVVLESAGDAT
jgi:uncharacterized protein